MSEIRSVLKEEAILVDFDGGFWNWNRRDSKVEREVKDSHALKSSAGRYLKNLFLGADSELHKIRGIVQSARSSHENMTLPWQDGYARLLHNTVCQKYIEAQNRFQNDLEIAKSDLANVWDSMLRAAASNLNSLHNPADYPRLSEVLAGCYISHRFLPLSDETDVRIKADSATVDRIKAEVIANTESRIAKATEEPFRRLHKILTQALSNLQKNGKSSERFHSSWHDHLSDLLDILPGLNLKGDPELDRLAKDIRGLLDFASADDLKVSLDVRKATAQKAQAIFDDLNGMFGSN